MTDVRLDDVMLSLMCDASDGMTHSTHKDGERDEGDDDERDLKALEEGQIVDHLFQCELSLIVTVDLLHHGRLSQLSHRDLIQFGPVRYSEPM